MISLNILNLQKPHVKNSKSANVYKQNLYDLLKELNRLKSSRLASKMLKNKITGNLHSEFSQFKQTNSFNFEKKNLISYIISINLSPTNTLVTITYPNGEPKMSFSAGSVGLTKRQKKIQPMALIKIFKSLLIKTWFLINKPVAIHFKNNASFHESLIIKALRDKLIIKSIQSYKLSPHNGCRPKKRKRFKRRTKRMVLR